MYIDSHCHLELMEASIHEVVRRACDAGVATMVTVGNDLASSAECVSTAASFDGVYAAVGIHPTNAIEATEHVLKRLADLARHPKVVAIGETGLDWFREGAPPVRQEDSFRDHIRMAKDLDKTLVIHDRDAHDAIVEVLLDERAPQRTVFHCFSGGVELVRACAEQGWFMSFAGNVTFRNAPDLREAAAAVPVDLLLAETDAPFLSPHPHRGRPNEPARLPLTVAQLAELHGSTPEDMAAVTGDNARRAFALPS
ncbi:MAG: TatD family hydrolase [Euzebyales bacterium]|nr:TatD family hydrolase [Euzebyales bacterium]